MSHALQNRYKPPPSAADGFGPPWQLKPQHPDEIGASPMTRGLAGSNRTPGPPAEPCRWNRQLSPKQFHKPHPDLRVGDVRRLFRGDRTLPFEAAALREFQVVDPVRRSGVLYTRETPEDYGAFWENFRWDRRQQTGGTPVPPIDRRLAGPTDRKQTGETPVPPGWKASRDDPF